MQECDYGTIVFDEAAAVISKAQESLQLLVSDSLPFSGIRVDVPCRKDETKEWNFNIQMVLEEVLEYWPDMMDLFGH